jgi:hypothetical protein
VEEREVLDSVLVKYWNIFHVQVTNNFKGNDMMKHRIITGQKRPRTVSLSTDFVSTFVPLTESRSSTRIHCRYSRKPCRLCTVGSTIPQWIADSIWAGKAGRRGQEENRRSNSRRTIPI